MNRNSFFFILIIFLLIFFVLQILGFAFWVIRGIFILVVRYWYIVLGAWLVYYLIKKISPRKKPKPDEGDGVIEINDYEIR